MRIAPELIGYDVLVVNYDGDEWAATGDLAQPIPDDLRGPDKRGIRK